MHLIGTKVVHLLTGDYGFIVDIPARFNIPDAPKNTWVLWLTGRNTSGRVLWNDPKYLYHEELEIEGG